ncbi:hypothetical protein M5K25_023854 [Dendrobium thyrsiflorum]|uniref:Uncharacterized protein n=1 Tax=Dendrobium thyrsiflorum TaxID=117978 RepID=A0ABD0U0A9_DENTH
MGTDYGVCRKEEILEIKYFLSNWYQSKSWDQSWAVFDGFQRLFFVPARRKLLNFFLRSEKYPSNFDFLGMAAKKVDALEERLEGEMNQIKETVEERMSSMEGQVADLRDMMKKMLEFQTQSAASDAKGPEAKNINSEIHREEEEVEIVDGRRGRPHLEPFQREERGGGYGERQGYGVFSQISPISSLFLLFFCCKQQFTLVWVQFPLGNT